MSETIGEAVASALEAVKKKVASRKDALTAERWKLQARIKEIDKELAALDTDVAKAVAKVLGVAVGQRTAAPTSSGRVDYSAFLTAVEGVLKGKPPMLATEIADALKGTDFEALPIGKVSKGLKRGVIEKRLRKIGQARGTRYTLKE